MSKNEVAVFGSGCFWCSEAVFTLLRGIHTVMPGYAGGDTPNPTYFSVSEGLTGHAEVVEITFDPNTISYETLLEVFWHSHDPTTPNQQGADIGPQYRSIILTTTQQQYTAALAAKKTLTESQEFPQPIVTEIKPLDTFYPAEPEHIDYYAKHPDRPYCQIVISPKVAKIRQQYS